MCWLRLNMSCIKLTDHHEILSVGNISLLYPRHGSCDIMYPKGRQSRKLLKRGYWFYIAINWWFLCHHCNSKMLSRSALISVTNICQQRFFSSHLLKENSVGREVFRLDFRSYLYMHITIYSYYLKQDEKLCWKADLVRSVTTLTCAASSFLSHWLPCQIVVQLLGAQHESRRCNPSPINFHILN